MVHLMRLTHLMQHSGSEQQARQQRQREVEARLNVKIVYKAYPAAAAGDHTHYAIINASVAELPLADILYLDNF